MIIPVLVAGWNGVPTYQGVINEQSVIVPAAGLSVGDAVVLTTGQRSFDGVIEKVDKATGTVHADMPDGAVTVRVPGQHAMAAVGQGALDDAKAADERAISLVGTMTLFLGLMKVVDTAGGLAAMARWIRPLMVRLFPDVPSDHPAMSAMIMNLAANGLGLGNAATPFGIKAMQELDKLNKNPGTATNAMVLFLAINTSGVAVLPTGVIAIRAALGSKDPAAIFLPTLAGTFCHTIGGDGDLQGTTKLLRGKERSRYPCRGPGAAPAKVRAAGARYLRLHRLRRRRVHVQDGSDLLLHP